MESPVGNIQSNDPHSAPQPAARLSRRTRQRRSPKPASDPAPDPSTSHRTPARRSTNDPLQTLAVAPRSQDHPLAAATTAQLRHIPYQYVPVMVPPNHNHNQYWGQHPFPVTTMPMNGSGPTSPYYLPPPPPGYPLPLYGGHRPLPSEHQQPVVPSSSASIPSAVVIGKRKRRADGGHDQAPGEKDSDQEASTPRQPSAAVSISADNKKRTKTQRACDSCRSRKIRCDILPDSDPQLCQHCKQYGFECTFFLPITETRFKKKKLEEEAATEREKEKSDSNHATTSPQADLNDRGALGQTTPVHLSHSQPMLPSRIYESYDHRYHLAWQVSKSGDGLISVQDVPTDESQMSHSKPIDLHVEPDVIQSLLNAYFNEIAPILPIVTQSEFLATPSPPPILLYSICLVSATRRGVPQTVFDLIRYIVNSIIKAEDVLSTASITNIQALLILSMVPDCHSQYVPNGLSALWSRLGIAIRMAQDLGLHRTESVKQDLAVRRRLWSACVICDRWASLAYGPPHMIDVQDCDARLSSSGDPHDQYMNELVRLSIILGRVLKTIYSPSGLTLTTDGMLSILLADLESWKANLPDNLKYQGPDTPLHAGLLHLLYSCVCIKFWHVFMQTSYTCPVNLKFGLTIETWSALVELSGESIEWLDAHERTYDVWLLVGYAATSCALVQYHAFAGLQDPDAVTKLRKLRDCIGRWQNATCQDHMSIRRKAAEIISLLYESTQRPPKSNKDPSHPGGGGVFLAHGDARTGDYGMLKGTLDEEAEDPRSTSLLNVGPLTSPMYGGTNVNPTLNNMPGQTSGNVLDDPQASGMLEQFAMANGLLQGIPGGMFDWGQWDTFFARLQTSSPGGLLTGHAPLTAGMSQQTRQKQP